jgi:hypothetical protein
MESFIGTTAEHHQQLGLSEDVVQPWEDALRTDPAGSSFEWWYLDGVLSDGSKLTVEFHTKPPYVSPSEPLTPFVSLTLDRPDGSNVTRTVVAAADDFDASRDGCAVRIGANTFRGDLRTYEVHVAIDEVTAALRLDSQLAPWRPATGHLFCDEMFLAWLPAVPRGILSGSMTIDGETLAVDGVGYHDHNWGNAPLRKFIDHWYWGRARLRDYTVVTLNLISAARYGHRRHPAFFVADGSEVLASGMETVEFRDRDIHTNPTTGSLVADTLRYSNQADGRSQIVEFVRERDVFTLDFGKAGAYHRFVGDVTLEIRAGAAVTDRAHGDALWELLVFRARKPVASVPAHAPDRPLAHRP